MREARCGVSYPTVGGGDAYVIRTSLFTFYIHTFYWTCNSNRCGYCLICSISCYDEKIRQRKKHISVGSLEMYSL